jgi:hypothetical protein
VAGIEKCRRDGKLKDGDDFGKLVDAMLGLEGSKFAKAVESEAGAMLGESHSLTPTRRREALTIRKSSNSKTALPPVKVPSNFLAKAEAIRLTNAKRFWPSTAHLVQKYPLSPQG